MILLSDRLLFSVIGSRVRLINCESNTVANRWCARTNENREPLNGGKTWSSVSHGRLDAIFRPVMKTPLEKSKIFVNWMLLMTTQWVPRRKCEHSMQSTFRFSTQRFNSSVYKLSLFPRPLFSFYSVFFFLFGVLNLHYEKAIMRHIRSETIVKRRRKRIQLFLIRLRTPRSECIRIINSALVSWYIIRLDSSPKWKMRRMNFFSPPRAFPRRTHLCVIAAPSFAATEQRRDAIYSQLSNKVVIASCCAHYMTCISAK